jgi:preprotein translocase subunit SecG
MNPLLVILEVLSLLAVLCIIWITLSLNTKSDGLGAAITGASDSYRGAVGVEEQKRRMLQYFCYGFVCLSFVIAVFESWFA